MCVRVCVWVGARACERVCVRARLRVCVDCRIAKTIERGLRVRRLLSDTVFADGFTHCCRASDRYDPDADYDSDAPFLQLWNAELTPPPCVHMRFITHGVDKYAIRMMRVRRVGDIVWRLVTHALAIYVARYW